MKIFLYIFFNCCYSEYDKRLVKDFNMKIKKTVTMKYRARNRPEATQVIYQITFSIHRILIRHSEVNDDCYNLKAITKIDHSFDYMNDIKSVINSVMSCIGKLLPSYKYTFMIIDKNIFMNLSREEIMIKKRQLVTHFIDRLDGLNIYNYDICLLEFVIFIPFYFEGKIYNEMNDDQWKIIYVINHELVNYKIKLDIEEFNTKNFMCQYIENYFGEVKNDKINIFIKNYLCNIGLICLNHSKIFELGKILNSSIKEPKPEVDYRIQLFLIGLIKKSGYLRKIIIDSLNFSEMDRYSVFIEILKDLGVISERGYKIYKSMEKKLTYLIMCNINKFLIDDICYRIYNIQIVNQIEDYKRFLKYIYDYIEIENEINITEVFKIIEDNILTKNLVDVRNKIIQKLNLLVNETLNSPESFFFLDSEHTSCNFYFDRYLRNLPPSLDSLEDMIHRLNDEK